MKKPKRRSPEELEALANLLRLGARRHKEGKVVEAERYYREVLERDPAHPGAMNLLGRLLLHQGDAPGAVKLIRKAIALSPQHAQSYLNLGQALSATGVDEPVVHALQNAIRLDPKLAVAHFHLALHHLEHKRHAAARKPMARAFEIDPANFRAGYLHAALSGARSDDATHRFVADLFDQYAPHFEEHLVDRLEYRTPQALASAVTRIAAPARAWTIFDLGCGTGLCGVAFREHAARMVGTDLSPRMVEIAAGRGIYDEVRCEDLLVTLGRGRGDVDLVVAADVFIYVGALTEVFAAAAVALRPGGLLAFSTERTEAERVHMNDGFRYAHPDAYVRETGQKAGFRVVEAAEQVLRVEAGQPVAGWIYLLTSEQDAHQAPV